MSLFLNDELKKLTAPASMHFQQAIIAMESIVIFVADQNQQKIDTLCLQP
jgi:hypothetical protein